MAQFNAAENINVFDGQTENIQFDKTVILSETTKVSDNRVL